MTSRCFALLAAALALVPLSAHAQQGREPDRRIEVTLDAEAKAAVAGMNGFAVNLYKANLVPGEDLFLSPASVSTALGLAYRGARGPTAEEMRKVVGYPAPPEAYARANGALLRAMVFRAPGRELKVANSLWLHQTTRFDPTYLAEMQENYGDVLRLIDFKDREGARAKINGWVEGETANRIRDLLHKDDISEDTRAVLVNTIYLKAEWAFPFDRKRTADAPFTLLGGRKITTPLMTLQDDFRTIKRGGVQAIALPYRGGETQMLVFLPRSPKDLPKFEAGLTPGSLDTWVRELSTAKSVDTILTLPRFHLAWRSDLKDKLVAMGMPTAMGDGADFGGMKPFTSNDNLNEEENGLKIGHVIHQTFLDVDENGSEAAAATAVVMDVIVTGLRGGPPPPPPVIFRADRPFLLAIRDIRTGAILFMGRVANGVAQPGTP